MKLRTIFAAIVATCILGAATSMPAAAQQTSTSSVTIGGGNFSAAISSSNFANLPYSFTDQYARNGSITVTVTDQTGDAAGWTITVDVSDFVGSVRPTEVIPSENLEITGFTIIAVADGSQPVSIPNMQPVYAEVDPELTWTAQPGYGQGSYNLNMTGDLLIPGLTTAQTYTSTGTLTIVSGP